MAYRQFLTLKKEHGDWRATKLSPSFLVDQMWHQHILDVVNYCHDMMLLCEHVVGHNPDGAWFGKAERDTMTHTALEQRFPDFDREIWGMPVTPTNGSTKRGTRSATKNVARTSGTDNTIKIKIRDPHNIQIQETVHVLPKTATMERTLNVFALQHKRSVSDMAFIVHGRGRIRPNQTPAEFGLCNDEEIQVYLDEASYQNESTTIGLKDFKDGTVLVYKVRRSTKFLKLFSHYAFRRKADLSNLRFYFDGLIGPDQTVGDIHLAHGETIDVMPTQSGC